MIANAVEAHKKGIIKGPLQFNLVMGVPGSIPATFKNLFFLYESLPADCPWTITRGRSAARRAQRHGSRAGRQRPGWPGRQHLLLRAGSWPTTPALVRRMRSIIEAMGKENRHPPRKHARCSACRRIDAVNRHGFAARQKSKILRWGKRNDDFQSGKYNQPYRHTIFFVPDHVAGLQGHESLARRPAMRPSLSVVCSRQRGRRQRNV